MNVRTIIRTASIAGAAFILLALAVAQSPSPPSTKEFGLSEEKLVQVIEHTEKLISTCMLAHGFQYTAPDLEIVLAGMSADKHVPGLSEDEFIAKYGFGISTAYTGQPPQLSTGYSPAKIGLGENNVQYFTTLSPDDRDAYNQTLLGDNVNATFAVGLETEDFSRTGGCTREAVEQVFTPEQLSANYYNPLAAFVNEDRRMVSALEYYAREMDEVGFEYTHHDQIEPDIRSRLSKLTNNGRLTPEQMSPDQLVALKNLRDFERSVAAANFRLEEIILERVEDQIKEEFIAGNVQ